MDAMLPDAMVIRHNQTGAPHMLSRHFSWSVINAGDVLTSTLLKVVRLMTMRDYLGTLQENACIVGDVRHSRVARSTIFALRTMGAQVLIAGPGTMCPDHFEGMGVEVCHHIDEILGSVDAVMMLRVQRERLGRAMLPSIEEYASLYGLNMERVQRCQSHCLFMHPGPINHGVEMMPDVLDDQELLSCNK